MRIIAFILIFHVFTIFSNPCKDEEYPPRNSTRKCNAVSVSALCVHIENLPHSSKVKAISSILKNLSTIEGLIHDKKTGELVLFGQETGKSGGSPYILDDLAIAYRNIRRNYVIQEGGIRYYEYPGCSIDPKPTTLKGLSQLGQHILNSGENSSSNSLINQWNSMCEEMQHVRIMGIPPSSHFAQVLVQSDYDMKRIVDGMDKLDFPAMKSLSQIRMDDIRYRFHAQQAMPPSQMSDRFWFYPGNNVVAVDSDVLVFRITAVRLLTEAMHQTASGHLKSTQTADVNATHFINNFTKYYEQIAEERAIYGEMEYLFRIFSLALLINEKYPLFAQSQAGQYLLKSHKWTNKDTPDSLPGRPAVNSFSDSREVPGGIQKISLQMPSCGGVNVKLESEDIRRIQIKERVYSKFATALLQSRPNQKAIFWTYTEKNPARYLAYIRNDTRTFGLNHASSAVHHVQIDEVIRTLENGKIEVEYRICDGENAEIYSKHDQKNKKDCYERMVEFTERVTKEKEKENIDITLANFGNEDALHFKNNWERELVRQKGLRRKIKRHRVRLHPSQSFESLYCSNVCVFGGHKGKIEKVKNGFRAKLSFSTWFRGGLRNLTAEIFSKTSRAVKHYIEAISNRFAGKSTIDSSVRDILVEELGRIRDALDLKDDEIEIRIIDEKGACRGVLIIQSDSLESS